jgi:hypothetical protein
MGRASLTAIIAMIRSDGLTGASWGHRLSLAPPRPQSGARTRSRLQRRISVVFSSVICPRPGILSKYIVCFLPYSRRPCKSRPDRPGLPPFAAKLHPLALQPRVAVALCTTCAMHGGRAPLSGRPTGLPKHPAARSVAILEHGGAFGSADAHGRQLAREVERLARSRALVRSKRRACAGPVSLYARPSRWRDRDRWRSRWRDWRRGRNS